MKKGKIYVLTNEAMPGIVKIGSTSRTVKERMKDLDTTPVPIPFALHYAIEIEDYENKEKLLHIAFAKDRIRKNREFFSISSESARAALMALGGIETDAELFSSIVDEKGKESTGDEFSARVPRAPKSTFKLLKIKKGSELVFVRDSEIRCIVVDETNKVSYENSTYSISNLTLMILKNKYGWKSSNVTGYQYWTFEDELLGDIREELDSMEDMF